MKRDNWPCQLADNVCAGDLNAHHRNDTTSETWNELDENLIVLCEKHHQGKDDHLGTAADEVAEALKHSNWMVKHRKLLTRSIEGKLFSPEVLARLVENQSDKLP
jgi:uncharacterized alpha-E superfamily protein